MFEVLRYQISVSNVTAPVSRHVTENQLQHFSELTIFLTSWRIGFTSPFVCVVAISMELSFFSSRKLNYRYQDLKFWIFIANRMINGKKIEAINIKWIHCENDGISNDNITFTLTLDIATKSEKHRSAGCVNEIVYVTVVINSLINVNYFVDFAGFLYSSDSSS